MPSVTLFTSSIISPDVIMEEENIARMPPPPYNVENKEKSNVSTFCYPE